MQLSSLPSSFTDLNAEVVTRLSADAKPVKQAVGKLAAVATTVRPHQLTTTTGQEPDLQNILRFINLSYDYRKFIVRSTYDSDLKRAEISLRNTVS